MITMKAIYKNPKNLRTIIIVITVLVIATVAMTYFFAFYHLSKQRVKDETHTHALAISKYLSDVLKVPMYTYDNASIRAICDIYSQVSMISSISVYNENNELIYEKKNNTGMDNAETIRKDIDHDGMVIGRLETGISYNTALQENTERFRSFFIPVIIYILSLSLIFSIIIRKTVENPIKLLISRIQSIIDGSYQLSMDLNMFRFKELHDIADRFNTMAQQIKKRDEGLKLQSKAVSDSNKRLKTLMNTIPDGILLMDKEGAVLDVNKTFSDMSGLSKAEVLSGNIRDLFLEDILAKCLAEQDIIKLNEFEAVLANRLNVRLRVTRILMEEKDRWLIVIRDISYKKRYEKDLHEQKNRLSITIDSMGEGIIASDREGKIELINHIAQDLTGYSEAEALGENIRDVFNIYDEISGDKLENFVEKSIRLREIGNIKGPRILVSRSGKSMAVSGTIAPIRDLDGSIIGSIIVFRDISEIRRVQEENLQTSKLRSLGILAGGISHDFANILTVILANSELLRTKTGNSKDISHILDIIEEACQRANSLTRELGSFAKGGELVRKKHDLIRLFENSANLIRSGNDIEINISGRDHVPHISIDSEQIGRVIHNILINAVAAMPGKKRVDINFSHYTSTRDDAMLLRPGEYVKAAIRDYGIGIDKKDIDKIFDPYFTTKSHGSGLGLAVAFSIIKKHGGYIFVASEVSKGSEFVIYLPV